MKIATKGFTLTELLIVISIIGILATVLFNNVNEGSAQSRDTKRQADLRNVQSALELYKNRHGRYPAGCNGTNWSGQLGSDYECGSTDAYLSQFVGTNQFIVGHEPGISFAPEFIRSLPADPRPNGSNSGYAYLVNADGSVYKLVAFRTVEEVNAAVSSGGGTVVEQWSEFKFCSADGNIADPDVLCVDRHSSASWNLSDCDAGTSNYQNSYALWGGYADYPSDTLVERFTEEVVCQSP